MLDMIERTSPTKPWMKDYTFILIQSLAELNDMIDRAIKNKRCSFDLESTGLDTRVFNGKCKSHIVGYSFCFEPKIGYYVPIRHKIETDKGKNLDPIEVNMQIKRLIEECSLIGHNWLKYDIEILYASEGIDIKRYPGTFPHHDTYLLARLAGMQPAGLKWLSKRFLTKEMLEITDIVPNKANIDFSSVSPYEGYVYAASDAICTNELFDLPELQEPIKEQSMIYNLERRLTRVVRKLERNKVKLDKVFCQQLDSELLGSIFNIEKSILDEVSEKTNGQVQQFQLDSPDEVSHVLFDIYDMNPKPEKGKRGNYKTDDEALEKLAPNYPLAKKMQEYRTLTKFHRTYIKNMILNVDEEGYLKFNFSQLKTDSGRFASPGKNDEGIHNDGYSGVNVQATPARYDKSKPNVRKCISCEQDEVIAALDWSGVEIRVACNMSLEPIWLDRFLNGDGDLHTSTASIIFNKPENEVAKDERQIGKCVDPDSILFVNDKYIRIGDISPEREKDTFYELYEDFNVKTDENKTAKIKQFYSNGLGQRVIVCFRRGFLVCSHNHRIELEDGTLVKAIDVKKGMPLKEVQFGVTSKKIISEIEINPFLCNNRANSTFFAKPSNDLSYVLGLFLGDGGSSVNSCNIHTGGDGIYLDWQKNIKNSLERIGLSPNINKNRKNRDGGMNGKVYFGSRHTKSILQQLEVVVGNKRNFKVPSFVFNGTLETKLYFLGGLLDSDGAVGKRGDTSVTTKYWYFAQDICVLLASCGFHYSAEPTYNKKYKIYYYRIRFAKKLNKHLRPYLRCPWKIERMVDGVFEYRVYPKNIITKVIPMPKGELVDIGIDTEEHIYLVNNLRTHNTFNFQSIYGGGPGALASSVGITIDDAKEKQQRFFGRLQTLKDWIKSLQAEAEKKGYCLTKFGRKRLLPEFKSDMPKIRANASRKSVNTPVQGSAADLMKLAMIYIDNYIEDNNLSDKVQMLLTMHDELVFRVKKTHIDVLKDIEKVMQLDDIIKKIKWNVPLKVDVEIGSSWDVKFEYWDMVNFLKDKFGISEVAYIYQEGRNYEEFIAELDAWKKEKKGNKDKEPKVEFSKADKTLAEFKNTGNKIKEEKKDPEQKERVFSTERSASAEEIDEAFSILKSVNLSDLPEEAYIKLRRSFFEKEVRRVTSGKPSTEDSDVELIIIVHLPIDDAKKNSLGFLIDSCPGKGRVKFITVDKEELHEDWMHVDTLKLAVMCKVFNI